MPSGRPLALVGVVLLVLLSGCSSGVGDGPEDARKGGSVLVGLPVAPDSLDPAVARSPEALQALWLAYTPPVTYRRAGGAAGTQVVPGLAQDVPKSSDGDTTFRFTFRDGLRYSDGRPLLAGDFVRALERALVLNPAARHDLAGVVGAPAYVRHPEPRRGIEGVVVNERTRTVRIELGAPEPDFARVLASVWAAPVPAGTAMRELSSSPPAGIGPYRVEAGTRGRSYVLTRRRGFQLAGIPAGNVDSIAATVVPDPARRTRQTLSGRLDVSQGEPPALRLPQIRSEDKDRYREFPTLDSRFVHFDLSRRPFADEDVRQAVAFGLDLQTLARLDNGFLQPSCNLIPPQVQGYQQLDPCPYGPREGNADLVRAEQLVRRSRDHRARVIVAAEGPRAARLARYGAETLQKIGLRARPARTAAQAARAQMTFTGELPADPRPGPYLDVVDDAGVRSDAGALERDGTVSQTASRWSLLDQRVVRGALVAPYGVATTGVLLSEHLDATNCLRFQPVYGTDLSSLCLR